MFHPSIHLPVETAGFRRYGQYFFRYEIGGVPVPVHWLVQYILAVPTGAVRNHPHWFGSLIINSPVSFYIATSTIM